VDIHSIQLERCKWNLQSNLLNSGMV
jgi:hypothetical protein